MAEAFSTNSILSLSSNKHYMFNSCDSQGNEARSIPSSPSDEDKKDFSLQPQYIFARTDLLVSFNPKETPTPHKWMEFSVATISCLMCGTVLDRKRAIIQDSLSYLLPELMNIDYVQNTSLQNKSSLVISQSLMNSSELQWRYNVSVWTCSGTASNCHFITVLDNFTHLIFKQSIHSPSPVGSCMTSIYIKVFIPMPKNERHENHVQYAFQCNSQRVEDSECPDPFVPFKHWESDHIGESSRSICDRNKSYTCLKSPKGINQDLDILKYNGRDGDSKNSLVSKLPSMLTRITLALVCLFRIFRAMLPLTSSRGLASRFALLVLWTFIILPGQSKRVVGSSLLLNPQDFCLRGRFLNADQQEICRNQSGLLKYVEDGILLGSKRCHNEFQYSRWNCSLTPKIYYYRLLNQDVRETAYIWSITAAAVTHAVTYACYEGKIPECSCRDNKVGSYDLLKQEALKRNVKVNDSQLLRAASTFEWGGCDDNVDYGYKISKLFFDNFGHNPHGRDLKWMIEQHNSEAGRLAITNNMKKECKCHGITGSCTLETCWNRMPKWQHVGSNLRKKFDTAIRVHQANDGGSLLPTRRQRRQMKHYIIPEKEIAKPRLNRRYKREQPSKPGIYPLKSEPKSLTVSSDWDDAADGSAIPTEWQNRIRRKRLRQRRRRRFGGDRRLSISEESLLYCQDSPNFCKRSKKNGSLGTRGRRCSPHVSGYGSCDYLCCGRSYRKHNVMITKPCNCKMPSYCCQVICQQCFVQEIIYICN